MNITVPAVLNDFKGVLKALGVCSVVVQSHHQNQLLLLIFLEVSKAEEMKFAFMRQKS